MVTTTLSPQQLTRMATDLRLACMRISRRVRFESSHDRGAAPVLGDVPPRGGAAHARVSWPRSSGCAKPSMTRTVGALVERGLVLRQDDPTDRRSVILSLTDEGRRSLTAIRRKRDAWMASRVGPAHPRGAGRAARAPP